MSELSIASIVDPLAPRFPIRLGDPKISHSIYDQTVEDSKKLSSNVHIYNFSCRCCCSSVAFQ